MINLNIKKIFLGLTFITMTTCGCQSSQIYRDGSDGSENLAYVVEMSSADDLQCRGNYSISTTNGLLCTGAMWDYRDKAVAHPMEIASNGEEIFVEIAHSQYSESFTLKKGDSKLLTIGEGEGPCPSLYVVVK